VEKLKPFASSKTATKIKTYKSIFFGIAEGESLSNKKSPRAVFKQSAAGFHLSDLGVIPSQAAGAGFVGIAELRAAKD
jgi:hypothetical protein